MFSSLIYSVPFSFLLSTLSRLILKVLGFAQAFLHLFIDFLLQALDIDTSQISEEFEEQVMNVVLLTKVKLRIPEDAL